MSSIFLTKKLHFLNGENIQNKNGIDNINDSMNPLGAHKDRHEKIGQGHLGIDGLKSVVTCERLQGLPFILETPNDDAGYMAEIELIRTWMK